MKSSKKSSNNLTLYVLLGFVFLFIMFIFFGNSFIETAWAEQNMQTYQLKLEIDGNTYWIKNDSTLSNSVELLTVGSDFVISNFINHVANNEGFVEGKYISGFKYKDNNQTCEFANNKVLYIGSNAEYTIVPVYKNETYTIVFTLNVNNDCQMSPQTLKMGEDIEFPIPIVPGYTLDYWHTDNSNDEFTNSVTPDFSPGIASPHTSINMIGKMIPNEYTLTFVTDEINNSSESIVVPFNSTVQEIPKAVDTGYAFQKYKFFIDNTWRELSSDSTSFEWIYPQSATFIPLRSSIPTQYTISYNGNGGTLTNATIYSYNITDLPLKLNANCYYDYDEFLGFTVYSENEENTMQIEDTIPIGTVGNITLTARWKAAHYESSNNFSVSSENYSDAFTIVNCVNISQFSLRFIEIEPTVDEIYFICDYSKTVLSKCINIQERTTPLTIHIKNMNWVSFANYPLIDARKCPNLTLDCIDDNKLAGGGVIGEDQDKFLAVIMSQNLSITGDRLTIIGSNGFYGANGGWGIFAAGTNWTTDPLHDIVVISIHIDYLFIKAGNGNSGTSSYPVGGNGGVAIGCWLGISIDNHENQEVIFLGGKGGTYYGKEKRGTDGADTNGWVTGNYIGSNEYSEEQ